MPTCDEELMQHLVSHIIMFYADAAGDEQAAGDMLKNTTNQTLLYSLKNPTDMVTRCPVQNTWYEHKHMCKLIRIF